MATTLSNITSEKKVGTSATSLIASASSEKYYIGKAVFTNTGSVNETVTIWRILTTTSPTTGAGGNWLVQKIIPPGKSWSCNELQGQVLGNSMTIYASTTTASVLNADLSGTLET